MWNLLKVWKSRHTLSRELTQEKLRVDYWKKEAKINRETRKFCEDAYKIVEADCRQAQVDFSHLYTAFEAAVKAARLTDYQREMLLMLETTTGIEK